MTPGTVRRLGRAAIAATALCLGARGAVAQDAKPPAPARAALEPPVLRDFVQATYPPDAEKRGLEAVVILSLDIDASGRVVAATVIDPAGNGFDEAALAAAGKEAADRRRHLRIEEPAVPIGTVELRRAGQQPAPGLGCGGRVAVADEGGHAAPDRSLGLDEAVLPLQAGDGGGGHHGAGAPTSGALTTG